MFVYKKTLEDLRWKSLNKLERRFLSELIQDRAQKVDPVLNLEIIAEELGDSYYGLGGPIILTPRQNLAIANCIEACADEIESHSGKLMGADGRAGHFFAGYIRRLLDRLIKGEIGKNDETAATLVKRAVVAYMVVDGEHRSAKDLAEKVVRGMARYNLPGHALMAELYKTAGEVVKGEVEQFRADPLASPQAEARRDDDEVQQMIRRGDAMASAPDIESEDFDDDILDFEITDTREDVQYLARETFDQVLEKLEQEPGCFQELLKQLTRGEIEGLEAAPDHIAEVTAAANIAFSIFTQISNQLNQVGGINKEALMPGLRSILDQYPGLKKRESLKRFVKNAVKSKT